MSKPVDTYRSPRSFVAAKWVAPVAALALAACGSGPETHTVTCTGNAVTAANSFVGDPGQYEFAFATPDHTTIGKLSVQLEVVTPPVNGNDTHLTWQWHFTDDQAASFSDDDRSATRIVNNAHYVMGLGVQTASPGQPQVAVACVQPSGRPV